MKAKDEDKLNLHEVSELCGYLTREAVHMHIGETNSGYVVIVMQNSPAAIGGSDMAMATNCDMPTVIAQLRWFADDLEKRLTRAEEP